MKKCFVPLFILLFSVNVFAANHYIRAGATGSNNGTSWTNAWHDTDHIVWSGAGVNPGDTLWVAGGNYSAFTVGTSGTSGSRIYIKRARTTDTECTGAAGWNASYDALATFTSSQAYGAGISFAGKGSYVTIDGRIPRGMKITNTNEHGYGINFSSFAHTGVTLRYLDVAGIADASCYLWPSDGGPWGIRTVVADINTLIEYCDVHGWSSIIGSAAATSGLTIQNNNLFASCKTGGSDHVNVFYFTAGDSFTIRYNNIYDYGEEGLFFAESINAGWAKVYNNIFKAHPTYGTVARGIETGSGKNFTGFNLYIYNNTFYNLPSGALYLATGTGGEAKNNIFWKSGVPTWRSMAHSYNLWNSSCGGESGCVQNASNPFVNDPSDMSIGRSSSAKDVGTALGAEYGIDIIGNARPHGYGWDIGAYEYSIPEPPLRLRINAN